MKYFSTLFFILAAMSGHAQYKGQVFSDHNGNNKQDAGEAGIAGVVVSDGYEVVRTDANGQFELPANEQARFVFIKSPFGYKHAKQHYIKVSPKTESYAFGLEEDKTQSADKLKFIQITDTETPLYGSWIDNVRNYSSNLNNTLVMHTGDICYEPGMKFHAEQVNSQMMGLPVYYTVGNHDLVKGEYGEKFFEDHFGPVYYSFEAGPAHFVVTPMWGGDYTPSYNRDQVIAWLKKDLALKDKNKPVIFVNHDFSIGRDFVLKGKNDQIDLKEYNLKGWLFGHWHNNYTFHEKVSGVTVVSTNAPDKGGIDNAVGQFLQIEVTKDGITKVQPRYTNMNSHIQLVDPALSAASGDVSFLANVYDSNRDVASVSLTVMDAQGKQALVQPLKAISDWSWAADKAWKPKVGDYTAYIEVHYANGEHDIRKQAFAWRKQDNALALKWTNNIGTNIWKVSPLLAEGMVISASFDDGGNGKSQVVAFDEKTGKQLWAYGTENSVKQKLRYVDGIVLVTDVAGFAYGLEAKSGREIWKKSLSGGSLPGFVTGPVLHDGIYYTGYGKYLSALNAKTGEEIWKNKDWNGGEAMPGEMTATDKHIFTGANWNALFVHDRATGELKWRKSDEGARYRTGGTTVEDGIAYVPGATNILKLDEVTGKVLAQQEFDYDFKVMASPLIVGDQLIMSTSNRGVVSLNKNSLAENWNFQAKEALVYTSSYSNPNLHKLVATVEPAARLLGDKLVFGGSDGYLYILDKQGKLIDEINVGAPILSEVTIAGNQIFVADFGGNVYNFEYVK